MRAADLVVRAERLYHGLLVQFGRIGNPREFLHADLGRIFIRRNLEDRDVKSVLVNAPVPPHIDRSAKALNKRRPVRLRNLALNAGHAAAHHPLGRREERRATASARMSPDLPQQDGNPFAVPVQKGNADNLARACAANCRRFVIELATIARCFHDNMPRRVTRRIDDVQSGEIAVHDVASNEIWIARAAPEQARVRSGRVAALLPGQVADVRGCAAWRRRRCEKSARKKRREAMLSSHGAVFAGG